MPEHVRRHVCKIFIAALFCAAFRCVTAAAQTAPTEEKPYRIAYHMAMPDPRSHLFEIRIDVETGEPEKFMDFQMPRWSPGRYGVFEFAKNVQEVYATPDCRPGERCDSAGFYATRIDTQTWRAPLNGSKRLSLRYKVFGDDLSGRSRSSTSATRTTTARRSSCTSSATNRTR